MGKVLRNILFGLALLIVAVPAIAYQHNKVQIGMPFVHFDIEDIYHQRWVSTYLRGKPILILSGHRYQRYEILKWAESFRQEYGLPGHVHLLWVVNLRKFPWSTSRGTVRKQWRDFNAPVPLLLDWNGTIGRALRVNYNVPNIILLDSFGRLAMHEMHTYTPEVYAAISARVRSLLTVNPGVHPGLVGGHPVTVPGHIPVNPVGRHADSN